MTPAAKEGIIEQGSPHHAAHHHTRKGGSTKSTVASVSKRRIEKVVATALPTSKFFPKDAIENFKGIVEVKPIPKRGKVVFGCR